MQPWSIIVDMIEWFAEKELIAQEIKLFLCHSHEYKELLASFVTLPMHGSMEMPNINLAGK